MTKKHESHVPNVKGAPGAFMGVGKKNPTATIPTMKKKMGKPPRKMA